MPKSYYNMWEQITEIVYTHVNGLGDKVNRVQSVDELYEVPILAAETKQIPPKVGGYGKWIEKEI